MTTLRIATIAALATALALTGTAGAQQSCSQFATMAAKALPAGVGSPQLVGDMLAGASSFTEDGIATGFDPRRAMQATGTTLKAPRTCPRTSDRRKDPAHFTCEYYNPKDARVSLDVDVPAGRVTFIDGSRRFDPSGPDNPTSKGEALEVAASVVAGLGVPPAEIGLVRAAVTARMLASNQRDGGRPPRVHRMEVVATVPRLVNDYLVLDSRASVAIDVEGRPARVHVVWPDFALAPGLDDTVALSRAEVIAAIVEETGSFARNCDGYERMQVAVGWVPGAVTDLSDEEGLPQRQGRYVPGIVVRVLPHESGEDSGQFDDFVRSFTLALVEADVRASDG